MADKRRQWWWWRRGSGLDYGKQEGTEEAGRHMKGIGEKTRMNAASSRRTRDKSDTMRQAIAREGPGV